MTGKTPTQADMAGHGQAQRPEALSLLASERPRNLGWFGASALLFGDWGTSRLYVLGIAFLVAGRSSFMLIAAMSVLILAVGWAYTQICRIYPNGGGVYSAARRRSEVLGVVAALLLFADYTITASLSAFEAFHYFGLGDHAQVEGPVTDPGDDIRRIQHSDDAEAAPDAAAAPLLSLNSPGLWGIIAIFTMGAVNLLGPKHSSRYAIFAAIGMVFITLLIVAFALPQIEWSELSLGSLDHAPGETWHAFVAIVLALSGVEAIASLTGVMKQPVARTATRSIWLVAGEVAIFNVLLALVMCAAANAYADQPVLSRENHHEDMLAFLASYYTSAYIGPFGEWAVRILGGVLLLSATNTALSALIGVLYVMSRDGELPSVLQKLNSFGTPWLACVLATLVPAVVLVFVHDLNSLAALYAVGIVGAVAIDTTLCGLHPRLRRWWRKGAMLGLGLLLAFIWVTLAVDKRQALIFVTLVMAIGFGLRWVTRALARRKPRPSLFRQAIIDQLTPEALARPRILVATAGGSHLAERACAEARRSGHALVVAFVREVELNYKVNGAVPMTLDNDPAAKELYVDFLDAGHRFGVPIIPAYDTGPNPAEVLAELAAMNGCDRVVIGSSRRGALHQIIKGSFQRKLERLLPEDMPVEVLGST